jgi:hypothetical protein
LYQRRREPGPLFGHALREWPCIPDERLPEPWSCNWACWNYVEDWYPQEHSRDYDPGHQATLHAQYGVAGLEPVMFMPAGLDRGPVILAAEGTYYLFNHQIHDWLKRFEGKYATVEEFIENGDWNRMELVLDLVDDYDD